MSEFEIKERLAQKIFLDMMREDGHDIRKLDYEDVLQELVDTKKEIKLPEAIRDVNMHKHDFVLAKNGQLLFLQVLLNDGTNQRKINFDDGLSNAAVVVIKTSEPFFEIAYINEFKERKGLRPITNNQIINVSEKVASKYKNIISKRFK